jgi:hypothetical protein
MTTNDTATASALTCAQCGRPAPADAEALGWHNRGLIPTPPDELMVMMLLCPACIEDDHEEEFDSSAGD